MPWRPVVRMVVKKYLQLVKRPRARFVSLVQRTLREHRDHLSQGETMLLQDYIHQQEEYYKTHPRCSARANNKGVLKTIMPPSSRRWRKALKTIEDPVVVNNLSDRSFSKEELEILALNLKYIPPVVPPCQVHRRETDDFNRVIKIRDYFHWHRTGGRPVPKGWLDLAARNKNWEAPVNTDDINFNDLDINLFRSRNVLPNKTGNTILHNILADSSIRICESDKNLGITIVNSVWYEAEIERQMRDTTTYEIKEPDIARIKSIVTDCASTISRLIHRKVGLFVAEFANKWTLPRFYVIPKIHKQPVKGRPIVPSHRWITAGLSRVLDRLLRPTLNECGTVLGDSRDLIRIIEDFDASEVSHLATSDVTSLYTMIPITDCINRVVNIYKEFTTDNDEITEEVHDLLHTGLSAILNENYFVVPNGTVYHQIQGIAMGTPIAPLLANIYMFSVEREAMASAIKPTFYFRYIDDIIMALDSPPENGEIDLLQKISASHPHLTFTTSVHATKVEFLDLVIYKGSRYRSRKVLDTRTHEKDLNKYLYLPMASGHPRCLKKGFIIAEAIRHARNCSDKEEYQKKLALLSVRLQKRGYHPSFIAKCYEKVDHRRRIEYLTSRKPEVNRNIFFPITWYEGLLTTPLTTYLNNKLEEFKQLDQAWTRYDRVILSLRSRRSLRRVVDSYYAKTRGRPALETENRIKRPHKRGNREPPMCARPRLE